MATDPQPNYPAPLLLNDVTYSDGEERPLEALKTTLAFAVDDWADSRAKAWVYGIVLGWDDPDGNDDAMVELAARHGWNDQAVARLRRLHAAFEEACRG